MTRFLSTMRTLSTKPTSSSLMFQWLLSFDWWYKRMLAPHNVSKFWRIYLAMLKGVYAYSIKSRVSFTHKLSLKVHNLHKPTCIWFLGDVMVCGPKLDAHLVELDPYHYYQGKGGIINTWTRWFMSNASQVGTSYALIRDHLHHSRVNSSKKQSI